MIVLNDTQNKLHHLSLFLGAFSNSYLTKAADDSQSNLKWEVEKNSVISREVAGYSMALSFKDLHLKLTDNRDNTLNSIDVLGLDWKAIDTWLKDTIGLKTSLDASRFNHELGFSLEADFDFFKHLDDDIKASITTLSSHRNYCQLALEKIKTSSDYDTTEIRIWPHHFDTGMLIDLSTKGDYSKGLGLGYAIADNSVSNVPYFYVYGWGSDEIDYLKFANLSKGIWATDTWKGALLPANSTINLEILEDFYREASTVLTNKIL